jgi:hypothetical protein
MPGIPAISGFNFQASGAMAGLANLTAPGFAGQPGAADAVSAAMSGGLAGIAGQQMAALSVNAQAAEGPNLLAAALLAMLLKGKDDKDNDDAAKSLLLLAAMSMLNQPGHVSFEFNFQQVASTGLPSEVFSAGAGGAAASGGALNVTA